jgi:pilus assembly protein FimV
MDRIMALLGNLWLWLVLAVILLAAAIVVFLRKRRDEERSIEEDLAETGTWTALEESGAKSGAAAVKVQPRPARQDDLESILVEEAERPAPARAAEPAPIPAPAEEPQNEDDYQYPFEDTIAGETGINLDQTDPMAEADFHMAYGLYDQAAHLVQIAIRREPQRRDLKLKLLEVFFVWGDRDQFLQVARELAAARDQAEPGEWEKIVIMGKQLAPDEPLFSQSAAGVGQGSVDLTLEGGQNHVDFDPNGEPGTLAGGVDLDLDSVLGGEADAGQSAALDFTLDGTGSFDDPEMTATTRQMVQPGFGEGNEPTVQTPLTEGPTVEQPQFDPGETLREKLGSQLQAGMADQTAELALDDLGLDLGKLDATGSTLLDDSQLTRALEEPAAGGFDAPTMIASLDDTPHPLVGGGEDDADLQPTELLPLGNATSQEIDLLLPPAEATQSTQILSFDELPEDAGVTSRLASLDLGITLEETGTHTSLAATDVGLDPGAPDVPDGGAPFAGTDDDNDQTGEARQVDLEPITMSEVGTKLDLARAYMDMGDPDGARSILQEVLQEGSMSQRQEAQRLIDSIPG